MGKKIETIHSPVDFYDNETIPDVEISSHYFALEKNASTTDIIKVKGLMLINKLLDEVKGDLDEKKLAEKLSIEKTDLSRVRRYRYKYFTLDKIIKMFEKIIRIEKKGTNPTEIALYFIHQIDNKNDKIAIA